jgi:hypothetical protein
MRWRACWVSVTVRGFAWRDVGACGFTLAAIPFASIQIAIAKKRARRSGHTQYFTFTNPIPGTYPDEAA